MARKHAEKKLKDKSERKVRLNKKEKLTKIRPVVVCPEISSPAQSLASVIKVPSNSLPWRLVFCSFCFGSFGANSGSLRQQRKANARQRSTISSPARKVKMLDSRKHHHFRSFRQSSTGGCSVVSSVVITVDLCCPRITHSPAAVTSGGQRGAPYTLHNFLLQLCTPRASLQLSTTN